MRLRLPSAAWLVAVAALLLAGCATPPKPAVAPSSQAGPWSGRLALQVEDRQSQSFSAAFELSGNAQAGKLALSSPLGGTVAVLSWAPGSATLQNNGQSRQFDSVDALVTHATGSAIPVAALFDWLRGANTAVPGWKADLSQLAQGRLHAERLEPPPHADLRVILDQ
jgi:outer membrane lipoprotein LolB